MYRTGHYGVALLVYAPVGVALLAAGRSDAALVGGALVLALTPLPDYDQRVPAITHRGVTHTVGFALLVGAVVGGAAVLADLGPRAAGFGFLVGALAVGAHLLADWLTPAGIRPFWPLSGREYSLSVTTAANPVANYLLLALGVLVTVAGLLALGPLTGG
ncbi:MAG: metal-dependent hydrolase [Halobacteriaceae archaeon]